MTYAVAPEILLLCNLAPKPRFDKPISPLGVTSSHVMDAFGPVSRDKLTSSHVMDAFRTTIAGKIVLKWVIKPTSSHVMDSFGPISGREELTSSHVMDLFGLWCTYLLRPMLWIHLGPSQKR